jgi:hypothetical protein
MTFADKIILFNQSLRFDYPLPENILVMNPFADNPEALQASSLFYRKYYSDNRPRRLILGINPGRFGAGVTGVPFTDSKRLKARCGIDITGVSTHELSSVFVYEFIDAYGGPESFYSDYYISAVCPLGFVRTMPDGNRVNLNYYDDKIILESCREFITGSLEKQLGFGIDREVCICFGNNKNYRYLLELNREKHYFGRIVPLEHPRFIMQYKLKTKEIYIEKYLREITIKL